MNEYMEYCFDQQETVLGLTDMSKDDFVVYWSGQVGTQFGIDQNEILGLHDRDTDVHNTEMNTRAIWKYGAAKGVFGTPIGYVNGVLLDYFPTSSAGWIGLLTDVYNSQWKGSPSK